MELKSVKPFDHRIQIRDGSGATVQIRDHSLHIVGGEKFYQEPPFSDKFYAADGTPIPLEKVPDACKRNIRGAAQTAPVAKGKNKGSEPEVSNSLA